MNQPQHGLPAIIPRPWLALLAWSMGCQAPGVSPATGNRAATDGAATDGSTAAPGNLPATLPKADGGIEAPPRPACAKDSYSAERAPVDLVLVVDASDSMLDMSGTETKWQRVRAALEAFVKDPASAGLGVGLAIFPAEGPRERQACFHDKDCGTLAKAEVTCVFEGICFAPGFPVFESLQCVGGQGAIQAGLECPGGLPCTLRGKCSRSGGLCLEGGPPCPGGVADHCELMSGICHSQGTGCDIKGPAGTLDVSFGDLPANAPAVVAALEAREPNGSTPMAKAIDSVVMALAARRQAHPGRRAAMILASDGAPFCDVDQTIDGVATRLARAFGGTPSIPTYMVGVFAPADTPGARSVFERFATEGGTRTPFLLDTGNDLTQKLLAALTEIRAEVVTCDYGIPQPQSGSLDLDRVNVSATSHGQTTELSRVAGPAACAGRAGWYFDSPPMSAMNPPRIVLCPDTCAGVQSDPAAKVDLVFGCATRVIE
jgi:hypothetical protein